ncbi:FAD-dependent monooxygenase [Nocardia terpenica]|uniref:Monooxygenase n=1 Tax=Nocardia terpenica TaxID=455432 RepID=A0A164J3U3_9NOCA|nr:FAD-dependent monooxygenase [Nocardia terpenica]KZM70019.1 monooxygenase [Nocardia terpenica]
MADSEGAGALGRTRRAVIAGAGIAGLAAALRLHRDGWEVLVVERSPTRRSGGYVVNLVGAAYDAIARFGLVAALRPRDIGFFTTILVHADGREKLTVPPAIAQAGLGDRALTVFRGDLETALYEAIADRVPIRFGTTVRTADEHAGGVRVTFSDGSSEQADLLVGADGLHSGIRKLVADPAAESLVRLNYVMAALPLTEAPPGVPENAATNFIGPGRTAAVVNMGPNRSSAFFVQHTDDPATAVAAGPAATLTAAFGDLHGGVPQVLRRIESDPGAVYFDELSQVRLDRWSRGRIVLLGDAAWCVTPFAGHGVGLAVAGADRLGMALAQTPDIPIALARWESALRPEVRRRQASARKGAHRFVPVTKAQVRMNEIMLQAIQLPVIRGLIRRSVQRANR